MSATDTTYTTQIDRLLILVRKIARQVVIVIAVLYKAHMITSFSVSASSMPVFMPVPLPLRCLLPPPFYPPGPPSQGRGAFLAVNL